jgi:predicted small secreted protein
MSDPIRKSAHPVSVWPRVAAAVVAVLLVAACNTVQGVGRDIESAGSAMQRAMN